MVNFIWTPKWKTNEALLSTRAISKGKTYIAFSVDDKYPNLYSVKTEDILKCRIQKNGKGSVYCIPLCYLQDEGKLPEKYLPEKEKSYKAYLAWKERI